MTEFLAPLYPARPWLEAAHIIFVIFWVAGLFLLPRLFVYHQEALEGSEEAQRFVDRERRTLKIILLPSIIVVWVLGLTMAAMIGAFSEGWFHAKLAVVIVLSAYHGWMSSYAKKLARGEKGLTGKQLRLVNEVPGLAVILIVILVVVKPF